MSFISRFDVGVLIGILCVAIALYFPFIVSIIINLIILLLASNLSKDLD